MESVLARWNRLAPEPAVAEISACCGSRRWAAQITAGRPYVDIDQVLDKATDVWWTLGPEDWLEAFAHHPRIGESTARPASARSLAWSQGEQSGLADSEESIRAALAEGNRIYEERFGYIYIVCASGRTANEMLGILRRRLENEPALELREAAAQQAQITALRLRKWLQP